MPATYKPNNPAAFFAFPNAAAESQQKQLAVQVLQQQLQAEQLKAEKVKKWNEVQQLWMEQRKRVEPEGTAKSGIEALNQMIQERVARSKFLKDHEQFDEADKLDRENIDDQAQLERLQKEGANDDRKQLEIAGSHAQAALNAIKNNQSPGEAPQGRHA